MNDLEDDQFGYVIKLHCLEKTPGHRKKPVTYAAWKHNGDGTWTPSITGSWARNYLTAPGESTPDLGRTVTDESGKRSVYRLACPICSPAHTPLMWEWETDRGQVVPLRESTLFEVLNGLRHAGVTTVTSDQVRRILNARV